MSAFDDFMKPRIRVKHLELTVPETRIVNRALAFFAAHEAFKEKDRNAAVLINQRLTLAKLERAKARG